MSLEGEALLIGTWKNIEDLEDHLTLEELELIVKSSREKEHRMMKFYAAFKGVDLDEGSKEEAAEVFARAQRRAEARLQGKTDEEINKHEEIASFAEFGIEFEEVH